VAPLVAVGVPVIAPFDVLSARPVGRVGETPYDKGGVPPDPVTGVNDEADAFCVSALEAMAWVALTGPLTVNWKMLLAVPLLESVTVTV